MLRLFGWIGSHKIGAPIFSKAIFLVLLKSGKIKVHICESRTEKHFAGEHFNGFVILMGAFVRIHNNDVSFTVFLQCNSKYCKTASSVTILNWCKHILFWNSQYFGHEKSLIFTNKLEQSRCEINFSSRVLLFYGVHKSEHVSENARNSTVGEFTKCGKCCGENLVGENLFVARFTFGATPVFRQCVVGFVLPPWTMMFLKSLWSMS